MNCGVSPHSTDYYALPRGADVGFDCVRIRNTLSQLPLLDRILPTTEDARLLWIRRVQAENFKDELKAIQQDHTLTKANLLIRLNPFIDCQGLLRVGGRLKHAILAYDKRHPVILLESIFVTLVVDACHRRFLHGEV